MKPFTAVVARVAHPVGNVIRRLSPAALLVLLFAAATLAAPAGALEVCQSHKRPGRFKIRAACKPGKETAVASLDGLAPAPQPPAALLAEGPPQPGPGVPEAPITHIFSTHEASGTIAEPGNPAWIDFGRPRTYEPTPPPGIIALPVGYVPSFTFATERTSDVSITFTAQCRIYADVRRALRVRFELDGVDLHENENEPNLCVLENINHAVSVTYAVADVPAGPHEIRALAQLPIGFGEEYASLFGKDLVVTVSERPE